MASAEVPSHDMVGKAAPLTEISDYHGNVVSQESFKNRYLVVTLWTPSIPESKKLMPLLQSLSEKYSGQNVDFIALDFKGNEIAKNKFTGKYKLDLKLYRITAKNALKKWKCRSVPAFFLVNKNGVIVDFLKYQNKDLIPKLDKKIINMITKEN